LAGLYPITETRPYDGRARERKAAKQALSQAVRRSLLWDLKDRPCADCGQVFPPYVMDFDHRGGKEFNLARVHRRSFAELKAEAEKCDVVCANCHRIRTFGVQGEA
jgi:hypothetical protein